MIQNHRLIMAAIGSGSQDGRFSEFRANPNEETARAISDAIFDSLMKLAKKEGGGKKSSKPAKAGKASKVDKKAKPDKAKKSATKDKAKDKVKKKKK